MSSAAVRLRVIKTVHTAIWFSIEAAVGYLVFSGFTKRRSRMVPVSAAVVAAEVAVYVANGFSCPLTEYAEAAGADKGSVTDIYLPSWLAKSLPFIHVPLLALIIYLHRHRLMPGEATG